MPARLPFAGVALVLVLAAVTLAGSQAPSPQNPQVFRAGTVLVPVDVRVLDRRGRSVTDLAADDFSIFENGVRQEIRHFSTQALSAAPADAAAPLRRGAAPLSALSPQNRRLFLIVLGRGRLQEPSKALDALLRFVRDRLLPQDQVAVMAWNRATDFSAEHDLAAAVIRRFRDKHEEIEMDLRLTLGGLAGLYAGRALPRQIQAKIDDVFNVPLAGARQVLPGASTGKAESDSQRNAEALLRKSEIEIGSNAVRALGGTDARLLDLMSDVTMLGMNFDDYVALSRQTLQDVGNLYAGIDYLRFIEGEKHLIFVNEQGFLLPSADYDRDLASLAAAARVAIDTVQTGGVATQMVNGFPEVPPHIGFALRSLRTVSETTGGQVSVSNTGEAAFDRILQSTTFGYLIGYTPSEATLDGRFRKITVEVKRKNVSVAYRRGYFARSDEADFDPRKTLATTRMVQAANFPGDVKDLKLSVKVSNVRKGSSRVLTVEGTLAADRVVFAQTGGEHLAALNLAVLCADSSGASVGELWRPMDMRIPADLFASLAQTGLRFTVDVPIRSPATFVQVIVYDYGADLIGSTHARVR